MHMVYLCWYVAFSRNLSYLSVIVCHFIYDRCSSRGDGGFVMLVNLSACAGCLKGVFRARQHGPAWAGVAGVLARGRAEVVIERERRATLALVLAGLPAGWCVLDRDRAGRERFIGPAGTAPVSGVRGVLK
jgi:hypothetical protein